jgi:hypothetical protein
LESATHAKRMIALDQNFAPPPVTWRMGHSSEGCQCIARYGETRIAYRSASERMKRERRLYANGAGAYRGLDDDAAYLQLIENVEAIIAEEQQVYWRNRGGKDSAARQTISTTTGEEPRHS